jgi:hypothetical protein
VKYGYYVNLTILERIRAQIFPPRSGDFFNNFFVNGKVDSSENDIVSYSSS